MKPVNRFNTLFNFASRILTRSHLPLRRAWGLAVCATLLVACVFAVAMINVGAGVNAAGGSDEGVWESTGKQAKDLHSIDELPAEARVLRLNEEPLNQVLNGALTEGDNGLEEAGSVLSLPMPDGSFARFRIQESPVMEPALAARHPEIKSYRGWGIDNRLLTMRCDWSPRGFYALVTDGAEMVTIQPVSSKGKSSKTDRPDRGERGAGAADEYVSYYGRDYAAIARKVRCSVTEADIVGGFAAAHAAIRAGRLADLASGAGSVNYSVGDKLVTYRIAIATTQEFRNAYGGGMANVNTWLNAVNVIYNRELSIHLSLISLFEPSTGQLGNGATDATLTQLRQYLKSNLAASQYDLGHALGTGSDGKAYIGVVCSGESVDSDGTDNGPFKAGGVTLVNGSAGNSLSVAALAHEIAHQFGAMHSFNANTGACGPARFGDSAYESGSGLTIMSLAGAACGSDAIAATRESRFHAGSFEEIMSYLNFIGGGCGTVTMTGNGIPTLSDIPNYAIPRNTPFKLMASGSDPNNDPLTYAWEQIDPGATGFANPAYSDAGDPQNTTRPIFRPFSASTSSSRTFPSLTYILNNANVPPATDGSGFQTAENLPNVTRAMNFRATVRDNRATGGGVNSKSMRVEVDGNSVPFKVISPNAAAAWTVGSSQTVNWSVGNTKNNSAINCQNVNILLSTDGGNNFPTTLAANTPNDGGETITVPSAVTTQARVKIEAVGNIFFDISDKNFAINSSTCSFTISPASQTISSGGGGGSVGVTASAGCQWAASSNDSWITVTSGTSGSSNGTVSYSVTANSGTKRADSITVAGKNFYVIQEGIQPNNGLQYYPLPSPIRLLDTRPGESACYTPGVPLGNDAVRTQQATGACSGIPASAKAIVGNATVVNFISTGFHWITLYPSNAAQPNASNLNFSDNQIVPNQFTVGLGADGAFNIYSHASTHFIVDVTGYYALPGAGGLYYHPLPRPFRLLDTRPGETACYNNSGQPLANNGTIPQPARVTCDGLTVPANAQAIVGNATVVNFISTGFGYITLWPDGATQPNASNLNYTQNQIVPNAFTVGLGSSGAFKIFSSLSTHFIVDVTGYFSADAVDINGPGLLFNPLASPIRLLETRPGETGCDAPGTPLATGGTRLQPARVTCQGVTIPASALAISGNATVVNFISTGFNWITLYPSDAAQPNASNLNFTANHIVPNAFTVGLSNSDGAFNIFSSASTHFIVDLNGYFAP
jgi:hypothetical protein